MDTNDSNCLMQFNPKLKCRLWVSSKNISSETMFIICAFNLFLFLHGV